ncbi:response regulator [Paenibacillus sp. FSL R7-0345]|uniref:response regulator n=1 Tax=Paenibacillus sp. FSL R7-0345 TaxID=2954535 RepID=UPI00315B32F5
MIRVVIIDDEKPSLDLLGNMLLKDGRIEVIGAFRRPSDAIREIADLKPDAVFLDMEMPGMNGVELALVLLELCGELNIIYVTAHPSYAVDAFKVEAVDYLLKPLISEQLNRALTRLQKRMLLREALETKVTYQQETRIVGFGGLKLLNTSGMEEEVKWRTSKTKELMSFLFLKGLSDVHKGQIIQALWPDCSEEQAQSNLHTTMYKLKKALKTTGIDADIQFKSGRYRMALDRATGDVWEFEDFVRGNMHVDSANALHYERVLELYTGDLFADSDYLWSISKREEMLGFYIKLSKRLYSYYAREERLEEAIQRIGKLLQHAPLDEEAHEQLLDLYFRQKDRISLIRHYHSMKELLNQELGLEPRESVRQLYNDMLYKL